MVRMVLSMRCGSEGRKYFYRHRDIIFGYQLLQDMIVQKEKTVTKKELKKNNKITMDFIWEGLPKPVREKVGKCSSAKELWDKLHDIYSSPIADSENAKEDEDTEQEERCSSCQTDSEEEEYDEAEVDYKEKLISAIKYLRKERE
jgi:hypothetical protein